MAALQTAAITAAVSIATGLAPITAAPITAAPVQLSDAPAVSCAWRAVARQLYDELAARSDPRAVILRGLLASSGVADPGFLSPSCSSSQAIDGPGDLGSGGGSPAEGGGPGAGPGSPAPGTASSSTPTTSTPSPPAPTSTAPTSTAAAQLPRPDHIVVVVEENEDAAAVLGSASAPYLDSLAARGASFTDFTAETHPSQPNYLALFSGDTQGVSDDSCLPPLTAPNLASTLAGAGRSFVGYSEDLPQPGFTGCAAGDYAQRHSPWTEFADVPPAANLPFSAWPSDFTRLPSVAFVTPNLCDDMHDCDVATGDGWLRTHLGPYADWATAHHSWLVVTWDEASDSSPDNRIATLIVGAGVKPGSYPEPADHYRLLRTITDAEGLAPLGRTAQASPITDIWTTATTTADGAGANSGPPSGAPPQDSSARAAGS